MNPNSGGSVRRLVGALAVALCACGAGGDLSGGYSGTVPEEISCSDGSGQSQTQALSLTVEDNGSAGTVTFAGQCSPVSLSGAGSVMTMGPRDCGTVQTSNGPLEAQLQSGNIAAASGGIDVDLVVLENFQAGVTCTTHVHGFLAKN